MYSFDSRVRFSEVGDDKAISLTSIINYFQDCSTFHSEDVGVGIEYLEARHRVWLMSAWQIQIKQYPVLGDPIKIGTWPYDFKSMFGYRNFIMLGKSNQTLAVANSIWVYYDTEKKCPARILDENVSAYESEPAYDMEYAPRKIKLPEHAEPFEAFHVTRASLDTNHHVNNGQYIRMAENFLPDGFIITQMRADYRMSALLGDLIIPMICHNKNQVTVILANTEHKPYVVVEFTGAFIE